MKILESKEEFDSLINAGESILIDFSATWCGPCKVLIPQLEEAEKLYNESNKEIPLKFLKADVDNEKINAIVSSYMIRNVPTVMLFNKGILSNKFTGVKSKDQIIAFIDGSIKN